MSNQRYILVGDGDGHDYVIPFEKKDDWYDWVDNYDGDSDAPEYAERVDGRLTFADPRTY